MAFSQQTTDHVQAVAERARGMWQYAKPRGAFPWLEIGSFLLNLFMSNCGKKAKTTAARDSSIKRLAMIAHENGVGGCIEACCGDDEHLARHVRKRLARRFKIKNEEDQDRHVFNYLTAANAERETAVAAVEIAVENDECDEEEE